LEGGVFTGAGGNIVTSYPHPDTRNSSKAVAESDTARLSITTRYLIDELKGTILRGYSDADEP
jgi:hypothetical protein